MKVKENEILEDIFKGNVKINKEDKEEIERSIKFDEKVQKALFDYANYNYKMENIVGNQKFDSMLFGVLGEKDPFNFSINQKSHKGKKFIRIKFGLELFNKIPKSQLIK